MTESLTCQRCATPLDGDGSCVTCAAREEGLHLVERQPYAQVRELQLLLEGQGIEAEIEQVPALRPQEKQQPAWNLYVPAATEEQARAFIKKDWAALIEDEGGAAAAARGDEAVQLVSGGEIACPACAHRFAISAAQPDCPECGLTLWVGEAAGADAGQGEPG